MLGSRTIKVLAALVVAMTIGAFALLILDKEPIKPPAARIAALAERNTGASAIIRQTNVPIQPIKWHRIVIHSSQTSPEIEQRCHFVIESSGKGLIRPTALWRQQADGRHTYVRYPGFNTDSIGICVRGDFSANRPTGEQTEALVALVRALQEKLDIRASQVYLHSDLDSRSNSPGPLFPATTLGQSLLR